MPGLHMGAWLGGDFARGIGSFLRVRRGDDVALDEARSPMKTTIANRAILPMFPEDFYRAITDADEAGLAEFLPGRAGHADIPWDDPKLLAHLLRRRSVRRAFDRLFGEVPAPSYRLTPAVCPQLVPES